MCLPEQIHLQVHCKLQLLLFKLTNSCIIDTYLSWNRTSLSLLFLFCLAGTVLLSLVILMMCYFTEFRRKIVSYHDWYGNVDTLELYFDSIPCVLAVINKSRNALGKNNKVLTNI